MALLTFCVLRRIGVTSFANFGRYDATKPHHNMKWWHLDSVIDKICSLSGMVLVLGMSLAAGCLCAHMQPEKAAVTPANTSGASRVENPAAAQADNPFAALMKNPIAAPAQKLPAAVAATDLPVANADFALTNRALSALPSNQVLAPALNFTPPPVQPVQQAPMRLQPIMPLGAQICHARLSKFSVVPEPDQYGTRLKTIVTQ